MTTDAQAQREAALAHAERDLAAINRLLECEAWEAYFLRRLRERRAILAKALEDQQPEADTIKLRMCIGELDLIMRLPEQDRACHAQTIRSLK